MLNVCKPQDKVWCFFLKNGTDSTFQKGRDATPWKPHFIWMWRENMIWLCFC